MTDDRTVSGWRQGLDADGKLLLKEDFVQAISTPDEAHAFAYEAYSMVWYLAMQKAAYDREVAAEYVQEALDNINRGSSLSPGVAGRLNPYFVEKPKDADY